MQDITVRILVEYEKDLVPIVRLIFVTQRVLHTALYRVAIFVGL